MFNSGRARPERGIMQETNPREAAEQARFQSAMQASIDRLHETARGTVGDSLSFRLIDCSAKERAYTLRASTAEWMRNVNHTLHGGMCAAVLDQAMGFAAYCAMPAPGIAPTIQLQVNYLRAIPVGEDVNVRMRVVSATKHLIHITAEAWTGENEGRTCLTASATYFFRAADAAAPTRTD